MVTLRCCKCIGNPQLVEVEVKGIGIHTSVYECPECGYRVSHNQCDDY